MLLFRSEDTAIGWCRANRVPVRPFVNLSQIWFLAVQWYENRLTVESRRPGADEMGRIFSSIGLHGDFWNPSADRW